MITLAEAATTAEGWPEVIVTLGILAFLAFAVWCLTR